MSLPSLILANTFSTTRIVSDAMSSLLTYSGEMFSIDPTMCFNVERVTSKSRIVCCEQAPSGPGRILVKLVIFLNSEMQCFELPNYNNGLFSGERLYIGSWLIPSDSSVVIGSI